MKNQSIQKNIIITIVILMSIIAIILSFLITSTFYIQKEDRKLDQLSKKLEVVNEMNKTVLKSFSSLKQIMVAQGEMGVTLMDQINKYTKDLQEQKITYESYNLTTNELNEINSIMNQFMALTKLGEKMAYAFLSEDTAMAEKLTAQFMSQSGAMENAIEQIAKNIAKLVNESTEVKMKLVNQTQIVSFIMFALSLMISFFFARRLIKSVYKILNDETENLIKEKDDLTHQLNSIAKRLIQNYDKLRSSSHQLDSSSDSLSSSSARQASATEESVAAMEEISSMIQRTTKNSGYSLDLANNCRQEVKEGTGVINTLTNAVDTINESNKELAQIANFIEEIHDKTKIINSIVVKTELLSFNASIEAARAAEYGMGFAVVAEEVGNLARLSGESAKEIENLLHTSGEKVVEIIESIKERVKHGKERTEECVNVFGKIDKLTEELTEKVNSITQASNEQEKGIMQTTEAMTEISNATQNNLKTTKDASSMANTVKSEINDLSSTINQLKELIETENRLKEENLRNQLQKKGILTEDQIEASSKV